jgi:hypothetical protein
VLQRDFCYWLTGYFELGGSSLPHLNINCVSNHLNMALLNSDPNQPKALAFCQWLSVEISAPDFNLKKIQNRLHDVFIHEIDPSFPDEDQDTLNQIHNSGTMRC